MKYNVMSWTEMCEGFCVASEPIGITLSREGLTRMPVCDLCDAHPGHKGWVEALWGVVPEEAGLTLCPDCLQKEFNQ